MNFLDCGGNMVLETPVITPLPEDQSSSVTGTRSRLSLKRRNPLFQAVLCIRTHFFEFVFGFGSTNYFIRILK
jgi:hypothetical protein